MKKLSSIALLALSACCLSAGAQDVKIKGILQNNRYDDGETMKSTWIGSLYDADGIYTGKTAYIVDNGIYAMTWNGTALTTPAKEPAVNLADIKQGSQIDYEKALWATNFNMMYGNSGACYVNGQLVTVFSRDESSTVDDELFRVCKWDAVTGNLLYNQIHPKSDHLESAGMAYNPKDGKVYGLFYLTGNDLPEEITSDPDYFGDQDDDLTDGDAGYAICTVDLKTMMVTPITPGLYYDNFVTFAINSEGRAFALTSGGANGYIGDDGRVYNINNQLTGAQLYEFDLTTGLKILKAQEATDPESSDTYTEYVPTVGATGYCSQYKRQSACFAKSNPNVMYWNGFYNSGKGVNDYGSWTTLSDKEWRTNHKYDTCLYEVDITTGKATRLATIDNRCSFSCLWVDGDDCSDGANIDVQGIKSATLTDDRATQATYNLNGQRVDASAKGLYIVNGKKVVK